MAVGPSDRIMKRKTWLVGPGARVGSGCGYAALVISVCPRYHETVGVVNPVDDDEQRPI